MTHIKHLPLYKVVGVFLRKLGKTKLLTTNLYSNIIIKKNIFADE